MVLGLVPDGPVDGVRSVGNAAGAGAVRALLSRRAAGRDGGGRPRRDEDRDRDRAALPGAVRGGDGVPARHGAEAGGRPPTPARRAVSGADAAARRAARRALRTSSSASRS